MKLEHVDYTVTYWGIGKTGQFSSRALIDLDAPIAQQLDRHACHRLTEWPQVLGSIVTHAMYEDPKQGWVELSVN